jgi:serine phosphatase RsbU (regulator of sigma subunit)
LLERSPFAEEEIDLAPGDGFLLHTDGLYGSAKTTAKAWTPERLRTALDEVKHATAQELLVRIVRRVAPEDGPALPDDLAAVAVRRLK